MADGIKISELPNITLPYGGNELIPMVQSTETRASSLSSLVNFLSGALAVDIEIGPIITSNYNISAGDTRKQFLYSLTDNITAFITESANIDNFSCTFSQLNFGSITIKFEPTYTTGTIISINNIDTTITKGASINIKRTANNQFLVSPVFFSLVQ